MLNSCELSGDTPNAILTPPCSPHHCRLRNRRHYRQVSGPLMTVLERNRRAQWTQTTMVSPVRLLQTPSFLRIMPVVACATLSFRRFVFTTSRIRTPKPTANPKIERGSLLTRTRRATARTSDAWLEETIRTPHQRSRSISPQQWSVV